MGSRIAESSSPGRRRVAQDSPTRKSSTVLPLTDRQVSSTDSQPLRAYWQSLGVKHSQNPLLASQDISSLPADWVVISINVTTDKTTMFISRHQANHEPIVFSLPLDRQGKREGEAESEQFTFESAVKQLTVIIDESNDGARNAKHIVTREGREKWWEKRHDLDRRMKELVEEMENCWLGAFKVSRSLHYRRDSSLCWRNILSWQRIAANGRPSSVPNLSFLKEHSRFSEHVLIVSSPLPLPARTSKSRPRFTLTIPCFALSRRCQASVRMKRWKIWCTLSSTYTNSMESRLL